MRNASDIYEETKNELLINGNQSSNSAAIIAIEKAQKEMFYFLYNKAELEENKNLSLIDFFDKLDRMLLFK
jgi:hypothetical protein